MKYIILIFLFFLVTNMFANIKSVNIAIIQPELVWGNVDENISAFQKRIANCDNCDIIIFPELFVSGCEMKKDTNKIKNKDIIAARFDEVKEKMLQWAKEKDAIIMGSTIYKEENKYFNRLIVAFPDGKTEFYDKHNCFKKGQFSPGKSKLIFDYKGFKIAPFICYDLRFPEWSENKEGYDLAIYIANWPASRREDWNTLLKERAIQNNSYVIGVNCTGYDLSGLYYAGDSCLLDKDGNILAICKENSDEILQVLLEK